MSSFRQLMMKNKATLNPLIVTVGSPTISSNFKYSNISQYSYIYINQVFPLSTANTWKMQCKFKYAQNPDPNTPIPFIAYYGNNSNDGKSPVLRAECSPADKIRCLLSSVGNSNWNINVDVGTFTFSVGTTYYLEYGFTGSKYYVLNLDNNTEIWNKSSSLKVNCSNKIALMHNGYNNGTEYCPSEMDLNKFKVYINDSLYFSAVV